MKKLAILLLASILLSSCSDLVSPNIEPDSQTDGNQTPKTKTTSALQTDSDVWVGAYLASYNHYAPPTGNWGNLPTDEIDWDAFTHLFYFALNAKADGSLSAIAPYQNMSPDRINAAVSAAHDAGKPVLFTIGGWGNYDGFSSAIKPANRATFIANIVATMQQWGFDGVDLDMEPIQSGDVDNYIAFIDELNIALQSVSVPMVSEPLISVVTNWHPDLFAQIHDKVDQVNLMTYDFSGAWPGWVSWHNAAVYSGGLTFESNGKALPSIDEKVKAFIEAGVPASKLGIGIDFYGYVWSGGSGTTTGGVTKPNQAWTTAPTVTDNVPYHKIMDQYYQSGNYRWDEQAQAAYLTIDQAGSANDMFISYDDEKSIQAKFDYARQKGLGGTIIWELSGGYRKDQPAGERDKLLQAVKQAMNDGSSAGDGPTADNTAPSVSVSAPSDGSTVSGTVDISTDASDNIAVSNVELMVDGVTVKNFSAAPYTYSWNTTDHPNHDCVIEATARDAAGNSSSSSVTVTISNSTDDGGNSSSEGLSVYEEALNSPWINSSWSSSVNFNSTEKVYAGSRSVKVVQNAWGALSLHSGNWGAGVDVDPSKYEAVEFKLYMQSQQGKLSLRLQNDQGQSFPKLSYGSIPANQWVTVSVPMDELNPNGQSINRINILETSGSQRTYYVDDLKFVGSGSGSAGDGTSGGGSVDAPLPVSPANGSTGVSASTSLSWSETAAYYDLVVASDASFQNVVAAPQGLTTTSYSLSGLASATTYYWKVKAIDDSGTESSWSSASSFTTEAAQTGDSYQDIYGDGLKTPWINTSWSASVDFGNTEQAHSGSSAVKVVQNAWGSFSIHSGNWGQTKDIDPSGYKAIEFSVYATNSGTSFNVMFENDNGTRFPKVTYGSVPTGQWVTIRIPMDELNPKGQTIHRLDILETSGSTKTYYVDDVRWVRK